MILPSPDVANEEIPLPPDRLRYKVAGTEASEWFIKSGQMSVLDLDRALASIGRLFDEFSEVLEWGCGCGRILRHLPPPHAPKRLHGNDIDREAIAWVSENLPWVATSRTDGMPPLPYADNSFDLIFNHSVMTHLDATYQDAWLAELRRVLRPGGIVTLTVSGRNAFQMYLETLPADTPARMLRAAELHGNGIVFIGQDQWTGDFPDFYHTTFHDVDYIFDHWAKFLDIRSYIPRGALDYQDMIVLQKPVDEAGAARTYQDYLNLQEPAKTSELQRAMQEMQRENEINAAELQRVAEELRRERAMLLQANAQLQRVYAS